jgi:hypothetical protein
MNKILLDVGCIVIKLNITIATKVWLQKHKNNGTDSTQLAITESLYRTRLQPTFQKVGLNTEQGETEHR